MTKSFGTHVSKGWKLTEASVERRLTVVHRLTSAGISNRNHCSAMGWAATVARSVVRVAKAAEARMKLNSSNFVKKQEVRISLYLGCPRIPGFAATTQAFRGSACAPFH